MASGKRYYWLKLNRNFFKRHDIRIIEEQENGKDYVLFYLKLLVESIDHEGHLRFNDMIPYDEKMLAVITNTNVDIVRSAIKLFSSLGLMERLDDETIYMTETQKMIGSETDWARKKRRQRNQEKITEGDNVPEVSPKRLHHVLQEIETDKEKEKELEKDKEKEEKDAESYDSVSVDTDAPRIDYKAIGEYWNQNSGLKEIRAVTEKRKKHLRARIKKHGIDAIEKAIDNVSRSSFMHGENNRGWMASFDWVFASPNNFIKTLEGNYVDENTGNNFQKKNRKRQERIEAAMNYDI